MYHKLKSWENIRIISVLSVITFLSPALVNVSETHHRQHMIKKAVEQQLIASHERYDFVGVLCGRPICGCLSSGTAPDCLWLHEILGGLGVSIEGHCLVNIPTLKVQWKIQGLYTSLTEHILPSQCIPFYDFNYLVEKGGGIFILRKHLISIGYHCKVFFNHQLGDV